MQRLKPFVFSFASRVLGTSGPVIEEVVQPEEFEPVEPPAMLPGSVERIVSADARSSHEEQVARITTRVMRHSPLVRLTYKDVLVAPDGYANWRSGVRFNEAFLADALWSPMSHVESLRYPITGVNRYYFGHWLMDGLSSCLIDPDEAGVLMLPDPASGVTDASRLGRLWNVVSGKARSRPSGSGRAEGLSHTDQYRRIFGLDGVPGSLVRADRLITYRDSGQGSHKRARYARMRAMLRDFYPEAPARSAGVYIRRGTTGLIRQIENEDQICITLAAQGWTILDISKVTVDELFHHIHGTRIVAGLDGSHINHAILMLPDDGALMVLSPPDRFTSTHMDHARGCGLGTGHVVLEGQNGHYRTSADEILRTAEMMLDAVDRRRLPAGPETGSDPLVARPKEQSGQSGGLDVDVEVDLDLQSATGAHSSP